MMIIGLPSRLGSVFQRYRKEISMSEGVSRSTSVDSSAEPKVEVGPVEVKVVVTVTSTDPGGNDDLPGPKGALKPRKL